MRTRPPVIFPGGDRAKWDIGITSITDLRAVATFNLVTPALRAWVDATSGDEQVWRLLPGTDADDPDNGIVRPGDYNGTTNAKIWYRAAS